MSPVHLSAARASSFNGALSAFQRAPVARRAVNVGPIQAKRVCDLTGAKRNKANKVCFSNKKSRTFQEVNLQERKIYFEAGKRWVKLKVAASTLRTIEKNGLESVAAKAGIDLYSLPYVDVSPNRLAWKAANPARPPMAKNPRRIKNPERIAASTKKPLVKEYCVGKIRFVRSE